MATLLPEGKQSFTNSAGAPLVGGKVYTYDAGTANPRTTYQDAAGTVPNANPVILDARGEATIFWSGAYKIILKDSADVTIWTVDNVISADQYSSGLVTALRSDLASTSDVAKGDALIGVLQPYANAVGRTQHDKNTELISVKDFGAKGDGVTDDTTPFQNAINALNGLGGGRLYIPSGTYITGKLTLYSNIWLVGEGRTHSTIKLKSGSNTDLIYGANSDALWGSGSGSGVSGVGLFELTLDGNRAGNLISGSCIAIYGEELYFQNIWVVNARDHGIRTEWADADSTFGMEGHYVNVRIDSCGKHGWWNNGPHDSVSINVIVIDASMNTDKTYDGIHVGPRMTGRFIGCHAWNRAASFRHSYALNLESGGGGNEFIGCHFEGAWNANVGIFCQRNIFDDSCRFYSAWNGVNIYMGLTATLNTIKGQLDGPGSGRPASAGIYLGSVAGDYIADNYIDVKCIAQEAGNIVFTAYGNNNKIRAQCYNSTAATIIGTPSTTDDLEIIGDGFGSGFRINNKQQHTSVTVAANASVTWNYPYAFPSTPYVTFSPQSPSGNITSGIWISSISATSVSIFNNNAVSMTLNVKAEQ